MIDDYVVAKWLVEELGYPFDVHFVKPAPVSPFYLAVCWLNFKGIKCLVDSQEFRAMENKIKETIQHGG